MSFGVTQASGITAVPGSGSGGSNVPPNLPDGVAVGAGDLIAIYQAPTLAQVTAAQLATFVAQSLAGKLLTWAIPLGVTDDGAPAGFDATINRLDIDTTAGAATLDGLAGGTDNQLIVIRVTGVNTLTVKNQAGGSLAINRFLGTDDRLLLQYMTLQICYYGGSINNWIMVS